MQFLRYSLLLIIFLFEQTSNAQRVNIIPEPANVVERDGNFLLNDKTKIISTSSDSDVQKTIQLCSTELEGLTALAIASSNNNSNENNTIIIKLMPNDSMAKEAYQLDVSTQKIIITASNAAGVFYAFESLKQLLPVEVTTTSKTKNKKISVPCCLIKDAPQYAYRGMHLDVSRHFFSTAFIKQYLDLLATFKINVFHWHLTDSHGWRLEIKQYPKLTSVGAWRADRKDIPMTLAKPTQPGEATTYGGFYTQAEVRDIINYAKQRNITIIPEIEMPGHCTAALVAYPQYSDLNNPTPLLIPCGYEGDLQHNFCAGYDSTYIFLENILKEVMDLFPSEYIHIGGDEVRPGPWLSCPRCQAKMKEKGFTKPSQLQAYFTSRIDSFITANGKRMMGWDEIVEADISKKSVDMSWHGESKAREAADKGNSTVMTNYWYTYFDFYQSDPQLEPFITYARLQLGTVYKFNATPASFSANDAKYILGGEACLWTENVATEKHAEYMLLPRLMALAEALWTPSDKKNYRRFIDKTELQNKRFDAAGIHYAKSMYNVNIKPSFDSASKKISITLTDQTYKYPIHYTTNGTAPTIQSLLYTKPFMVDKNSIIAATTFKENKPAGKINRDTIVMHKAVGSTIQMQPFNEAAQRLHDGIPGTVEPYDGRWLMLNDSVIIIMISLPAEQMIHNISMRFMEDQVGFLYLPKAINISTSTDGNDYKNAASFSNDVKQNPLPRYIKTFTGNLNKQVKFIKIEINNAQLNDTPDKNLMMTDEIIVQ